MPQPHRVSLRLLPFLLLLAAAATGCGGPRGPSATGCSSDDECLSDARCTDHSCVVNTPPLAEFTVGGALEASSIATFDGSASRDPDRGDAVTSYRWSIAADTAACPTPEVANTAAVVQVRFGCAGRYQVRLVVLDGKGLESPPATRTVDVSARSGQPLVEAGPDQAVDHRCEGTPLVCRLSAAVQLTATSRAAGPIAYRWSAVPPPGRELGAERRVRFLPDAGAQNPRLEIEADAGAISGDWQLRVEVLDEFGVADADVTRVSVRNRPPIVRGGPTGPFPHRYVPESRLFTAGGTFPVEVIDEDGDPVERRLTFHHAGDGGAAFLGEDRGAAIQLSIAVPYAEPADALHLIGGADLARSVVVEAVDVNGGTASADFPVEVANRAPVLVQAGGGAVDHWYDPAARRFVADVALGRWADPDGDPFDHAVSAAGCPTFTVGEDGAPRLRCSAPYEGVGSLPRFLGDRRAQVMAADPWASSTTPVAFGIGNRPPVLAPELFQPLVECRFRASPSQLCWDDGWVAGNVFPATTVHAPTGVTDPDGDPVEVRDGSGRPWATCLAGQPCTVDVPLPQKTSCDMAPPDIRVSLSATDGAASVSGSLLVDPACR